MILKGASGKSYQLEGVPFGRGGEGDIYRIINMPGHVVKIYHADRITSELEKKIQVMIRHPPKREMLTQIAWPLDSVYGPKGAFCGFVMYQLNITNGLGDVYFYPPQKNISYKAKLTIAQNICAVISEIHHIGFVFGDFNPRNIGVNLDTCRVAFLDTDSYHIDLVAVYTASGYFGLKADSTVVGTGYQDAIRQWTDIVALSVCGMHVEGLRSDGTIVTAGHEYSGELSVGEWKNIVAFASGDNHTVGLKSDGSLVVTGNYGLFEPVESWTDVVAVSAGACHIVGLKANGTAVVAQAFGNELDISGWSAIRIP